MQHLQPLNALLMSGAILGALTTYLFVATGITYRHRDNGLAYILFVLGVGVWNGIFAVQFLSTDPVVNQFFLSLSMVGALLAGLGWFLFASTASSTPTLPAERIVYRITAVLVGTAITFVITTPVHSLGWQMAADQSVVSAISPQLGYWLYTGLLASLFGGGFCLFAAAWHNGESIAYTRSYTVAGFVTVIAILGSNVFAPGGLSVAQLVAVLLTTVGWLQAKRWSGFRLLRGVPRRSS